MRIPQLIFVAGCNASGKSTFIRMRLNDLADFEIIMTDVYKDRTKEVFSEAVKERKDIIIETVFNDSSFRTLVDEAAREGYNTTLIALFLDSPQQSIDRVALRRIQQTGLPISEGNVRINYQESFKNLSNYFFYFDASEFIYTGIDGINKQIMSFERDQIVNYHTNNLIFPKRFAQYSLSVGRLNEETHKTILANKNFVR